MDQELLGRVSPTTQELLGQGIDLRPLRAYQTKDRGALRGVGDGIGGKMGDDDAGLSQP